ncbi:hypothetical protein Plhal304r1_c004g0017191 [Plasmopara halstedii]
MPRMYRAIYYFIEVTMAKEYRTLQRESITRWLRVYSVSFCCRKVPSSDTALIDVALHNR